MTVLYSQPASERLHPKLSLHTLGVLLPIRGPSLSHRNSKAKRNALLRISTTAVEREQVPDTEMADSGPSGPDCDGDEGYHFELQQGDELTYGHQQARQEHLRIGPARGEAQATAVPGQAPMEPGVPPLHEVEAQYVTTAAPMMNGIMHPGPLGEGFVATVAPGAAMHSPTGPVEWKMLEIEFSHAASLTELSTASRVWTLKLSKLLESAPWKNQLSKSKQRVGGLEVVQAAHNFPFQLGFRLVLPDLHASGKSGGGNKLPTAKYTVTSQEPVTFTLRSGQAIKSSAPVRVLIPPETLERSILSSYGHREDNNEPIWTPGNLGRGISAHPRQPDTLSMVASDHPIMHQIHAEKKRIHGLDFKMDAPDKNGLYQVANEDIEHHKNLLREDWAKNIKMRDLMDLEIRITRSTVEGETSGDDLETIWTNAAEMCDGMDLTTKAGAKAREKLVESKKKYRVWMTLGVEYAEVY